MNTINFGSRVSLKEAAQLIASIGTTNRVMLRGEKGIGKSSIMKMLRDMLPSEYAFAYIDCSGKDLGDVGLPSPNRELRITEFFTNAEFRLTEGKPVVMMLDEFSKATRVAQNMLHPLFEVHNPRIGNAPLPEVNGLKSIVFATGNLGEEGIGDNLADHTLDRLTTVEVRKPSVREWLEWGVQNNIHPALLAWVDQTPTVLASFRDEDFDAGNPYVYNPKRAQGKFITPRSLELASNIIWQRENNSENAVTCALVGTIGAAGANDIASYIAFQDQLPPRDLILKSPDTAPIPTSVAAIITLLFNLERIVDEDTITPVMAYISRLEAEHQGVFCSALARNPVKQKIAFRSAAFTKWASDNADIL